MNDKTQQTREWAIAHCAFSQKIENGYWSPFGEFLEVPTGICRRRRFYAEDDGYWEVRTYTSQGEAISVNFWDHHYHHDFKKSLASAILVFKSISSKYLLKSPHFHGYGEMARKIHRTGERGISLQRFRLHNNHYYRFVLVLGGCTNRSVYIGTEENYRERYDEKFKLAQKRYAQMKAEHEAKFGFEKDPRVRLSLK